MMGQERRSGTRALWIVTAASALVAGAGVAGLDAQMVRWTLGMASAESAWNGVLGWLDLIALKEISNFLLGATLLLAAGLLLAIPASRRTGWLVLYVGLVQFLSTTVADLAKPQLGRLRPWEALHAGGADTWFVGANSFPSGHTAFYAGLFLPLIILFPRGLLIWLVPPLFVAASRVVVHDHYLSDVAASLALAAALAAAFAPLARRGLPEGPAAG